MVARLVSAWSQESALNPGPPSDGSTRRRVAAGDCSPAAPTDPDVPNSGIRLLGLDMRYATYTLWTTRRGGSG
jgi:hypothetical protein